jgi:beta-glucosidase
MLQDHFDNLPSRNDFPEHFSWGVATSAFQIEGGALPSQRGRSIWDQFCEQDGAIADASNGLTACDHFHLYEKDLDLIKSLGVDNYRFSIAWPRVQPLGYGDWNEEGFAFYENLIDGAIARGLKPYATLYHWDLPQALHEKGGWESRETCQLFALYAAEVVKRFGHKLASIATHNEPWVVAILGYEQGIFAPGIKNRKTAYQVSHHLLLSHGMALDAMRRVGTQASLGIVLNQSPIDPDTNVLEDVNKAKLDDGLLIRWYMDPLLKGRYPQDVIDYLGADAPMIEDGDLEIIAAPIDFIGINYYTRQLASAKGPYEPQKRGLPVTDMGWEIYPQGLTQLLLRLHRDYQLPAIYITENGAAFPDQLNDSGEVDDQVRIDYIARHIAAVHEAIEMGVDVRGYFVWSLLDNFEWASGYVKRFGIVYVDYETQRRIPKSSAHWYRGFLKNPVTQESIRTEA